MRNVIVKTVLAVAAISLVAACTNPSETGDTCCSATIHATVPEGTGKVYLTSNLPALGPWVPDNFAMEGDGRERVATIQAPPGTEFECKFTLGTWDRDALGP